MPGHFIGWRSSSAFVSGLEDAAAAIEPLIQSAPAEATELFDAFLAGCIEKAEEIDDSGGDLGRFAKDWRPGGQLAGTVLPWLGTDHLARGAGVE